MDKIDAALAATEDNAAAIRAINRELKLRPTIKHVWCKVGSTGTSFGNVRSDGNTYVLICVPASTKHEVRFCNAVVWSGVLPAIIMLPKGDGELLLRAAMSAASALIFNGA